MSSRTLGLVAALVVLALPTAASAQDGWRTWTGTPTDVFRTSTYDRGEWIFTNGVGLARGANSDALKRTDYFGHIAVPGDPTNDSRDLALALTYGFFGAYRAAHNGDHALPRDAKTWPVGTGDLAELRLASDATSLYVRARWNAMPRPDAQIATLTFGTPASAAHPWPRNAGLSSKWDVALTMWGTGATVTTATGAETTVAARTGDHVTEARIPLNALPAGPWTLTGGAGLGDPAAPGTYWTVPAGDPTATAPGSGGPLAATNVWTLLFAGDEPWTFDELRQSALLSAGDASAATATVDPTVLARGASRAPAVRTGDMTRLLHSAAAGPDGLERSPGVLVPPAPPGVTLPGPDTGFDETWHYTGGLQPYGMHVPERYARSAKDWPLIVYLHGFGATIDEAFYLPVGFVAEADRRGYLVATPQGRGDRFYRGDGELDVREVLADVRRHYRVDPDRVYLMGHSMGGYGTNNVATRNPDLFAAVAPAEGTDAIDLSANLRNVPWLEMSAVEDLDANAAEARKLYAALSEKGYDATLIVYDLKIHEYSSIYDTLPRIFKLFGDARRAQNPATVTWVRPVDTEEDVKLGLVHDGAYWVSGVRSSDPKALGTITATSDAIAHVGRDPSKATRTSEARDDGGPSGRTSATVLTTAPDRGRAVPRANVLHVDATQIAAATIDARRARLQVGRRRTLTVEVKTSVALRLTLRATGARRVVVRRDGARAVVRRARAGTVVLTIPAGTHRVSLRRR